MNRRKRRRRKPYRNVNLKNSALTVFIVVCISVVAGYMTATYILGPVLGLEMKPSFFESVKTTEKEEKETTEEKTVIEDEVESRIKSGFAIQYGSFSAREGAQQLAGELEDSGITAEIIEKDGMFKVISEIFETKDEARSYMDKNSSDKEVFITQIP